MITKRKSLLTRSMAVLALGSMLLQSAGIPTANASGFSEGDGTESSPYIITMASQLDAIRDNLGAHYRLEANIDLSGVAWVPIGTEDEPFTGSLEGMNGDYNVFAIKNLSIVNYASDNAGLFGYIGPDGSIDSLALDNASVSQVSPGVSVGALAGHNEGRIANVRVVNGMVDASIDAGGLVGTNIGEIDWSQAVNTAVSSHDYAGGLVGANTGYITSSRVESNPESQAIGASNGAGGLVGRSEGEDAYISESYSTADVSSELLAGGLVGLLADGAHVDDSYALGTVQSNDPTDGIAGGLVGSHGGDINYSYAAGKVVGTADHVGGLVGTLKNGAQLHDSYWDTDTSHLEIAFPGDMHTALANVGGVAGFGTEELWNREAATGAFDEWGSSNWELSEGRGQGYPFLKHNPPAIMYSPGLYNPGNGSIELEAFNQYMTNYTKNVPAYAGFVEFGAHLPSYAQVKINGDSVMNGDGMFSKELDLDYGDNLLDVEITSRGFVRTYHVTIHRDNMPGDLFGGGSGESSDPYVIQSAEQLNNLRLYNGLLTGKYYVQQGDISLASYASADEGEGWKPIGSSDFPFTGFYDGGHYKIKDLHIERSNESMVGLFGSISEGAEVKNIVLEDGSVSGGNDVGALAGSNEGTITGSASNIPVSGNYDIGGLVGYNSGTIKFSYASGYVSGPDSSGQLGGLVGLSTADIIDSYATGDVSGMYYVGGLVGTVGEGMVRRTYSTGAVSGNSSVGGLAGSLEGGVVLDSYWDNESSGTTTAAGEISNSSCQIGPSTLPCDQLGRTTVEMHTAATYSGWDFENDWDIVEGESTPYLRASETEEPQTGETSVTDFEITAKAGGQKYAFMTDTDTYHFKFTPTKELHAGDTITLEVSSDYRTYGSYYWNPAHDPFIPGTRDVTMRTESGGDAVPITATAGAIDSIPFVPFIRLQLGGGIASGQTVIFDVKDYLKNPVFSSGTKFFSLYTSADTKKAPAGIDIIDYHVQGLKVRPDNHVQGASNVAYSIQFTSMAPVMDAEDRIVLKVPDEMLLPASIDASHVLVNGSPAEDVQVGQGEGTIIINPKSAISSFSEVNLEILGSAGLSNLEDDNVPFSEGYKEFQLKTTKDHEYASDSFVYFRGESGSAVGDLDIGKAFSDSDIYISFQTHLDLSPDHGDYIDITLPSGVDPTAYNSDNVRLYAGEMSLDNLDIQRVGQSQTIRISVPLEFRAGNEITLNLALLGAQDQVQTYEVATSQETIAAFGTYLPSVIGIQVVSSNAGSGNASGYQFQFTAGRASDSGDVYILLPEEAGLNGSFQGAGITINGEPAVEADYEDHMLRVKRQTPIYKDEQIQIVIPQTVGFMNPPAAGAYKFGVKLNEYDSFIGKEVVFTSQEAAAASVEIAGDDGIRIPSSATPVSKSYTAIVKDQLGNEMNGQTVTWSMFPGLDGVTLNSATGEVTVTQDVYEGSFILQARLASNQEIYGFKNVLLAKTAPTATTIAIAGDSAISIPVGAVTAAKPYSVKVKDQYGQLMTGQEVTWRLAAAMQGVTVNAATGELLVTSAASQGTVILQSVLVGNEAVMGQLQISLLAPAEDNKLVFAEFVPRAGLNEIILTFDKPLRAVTTGAASASFTISGDASTVTSAYLDTKNKNKVHLLLSGAITAATGVRVTVKQGAVTLTTSLPNATASEMYVLLPAELTSLRQDLKASLPSSDGKINVANILKYLQNRSGSSNTYGIPDAQFIKLILDQIDPISVQR